jgi:hypothetical protein
VGTTLQRLADELTATLAGLLGYVAVLAVLGMAVVSVLEMDEVSAALEPTPRVEQIAVERPTVLPEVTGQDRIEGPNRPTLRQSVAAR